MRLRVFANRAGNMLVEISHPSLKASAKWFLPMIPQGSPVLRGIDRSRLVPVRLQGSSYEIPFLRIRTIGLRTPELKEVNHSDTEDSINILNHVQDILAWD